ncbi:MAG: Crp/Fnr family transcriptional regulator [Phycisphaerae bacterium]|nr:Crp/Fnr family transcriptional regulator [Phycisphaerae bacterium]
MTKPTISQITDAMRQAPLLSRLDDNEVRALLDVCLIDHLTAGAQVFSPNQLADSFYIILSGRAKVYKLSPKGDEQILHLYGPGNTFGQAAMWAGVNYPAHAEVLEEATLLVVKRAVLKQLIVTNPDIAMAMLAGMSDKLREFNRLIEQLSLKDVPARLAGALLEMPAKPGTDTVVLKQTKRELAGQIGTIPETLSRALKKLSAAGLIEVNGPEIVILDADGLASLADA